MKIALIQPPLIDVSGAKISSQVEVELPLGIAYIAASLEQAGHECMVIDAIVDGYGELHDYHHQGRALPVFGLRYETIAEKVSQFGAELVGISCIFFNQRLSARAVAEAVRHQLPDVKIMAGGIGLFVQPEWILQDHLVDVVVIGEGEETACRLAEYYSDGEGKLSEIDGIAYLNSLGLQQNPKARYIEDLDSLPVPAYHLFDLEKIYRIGIPFGNKSRERYLNFLTSRGCPYECVFCAAHNIWERRTRYRSPEPLFEEIRMVKELYGVEEIHFSDENLTLKRKRAVAFLQGMKEMGLCWSAPNGLMINTLNEELVKLMAESGCYSVSLAIESGSPRVLKEVVNKPMQMRKVFPAVKLLKQHGIHTRGFFIIGMPGETQEEIWQTLLLSHFLELDQNEVMIALPYPGTALYAHCIQQGLFSRALMSRRLIMMVGRLQPVNLIPLFSIL